MMTQPLPRATFIEAAALPPTVPETENAPAPKVDADLFTSYFDNYVTFLNETPKTYVYEISAKFPEDTSVYQEYDRDVVAEQKRQELTRYVRVAFANGHLAIDPSILPEGQLLTVDTLADAMVTDSILRAQERYDEAHLEISAVDLPAHVARSETATNEQQRQTFFGQVAQLGARAFQAITLQSGEVTIPQPASADQ